MASMRELLLEAMAKADAAVETDELSWIDNAIEFINENKHIGNGVVLLINKNWYGHLMFGINSHWMKHEEFEYHKAGGFGIMRMEEFEQLLEKKNAEGMEIRLVEMENTEDPGIKVAHVYASQRL